MHSFCLKTVLDFDLCVLDKAMLFKETTTVHSSFLTPSTLKRKRSNQILSFELNVLDEMW